jgi:hypothetical protein
VNPLSQCGKEGKDRENGNDNRAGWAQKMTILHVDSMAEASLVLLPTKIGALDVFRF